MEPLSPEEFCQSVEGNPHYEWKIAGFVTEDLLVLKHHDTPLVIRSQRPGRPPRYEWYSVRRLKAAQKRLKLIP